MIHLRAATVVVYVECPTGVKIRHVPRRVLRRVPRHVPRRICRMIEGNVCMLQSQRALNKAI